jgi:hypothetical protein
MKFGKILAVIGLSLTAVACGSGGGSSGPALTSCGTISGDPYCRPWFDVLGVACNSGQSMYPLPGCNFYADGVKIAVSEDPFYTLNPYLLIPNSNTYVLTNGSWEYVDSYGNLKTYSGFGWLTPDGLLYDEFGYALNEEGSDSESRDLMGEVAQSEKAILKRAASNLSEEFALNEESSLRIATTLNDWATLGKKHARTEKDIAAFSERLYGVKADSVKTAITKAVTLRDLSGIDSLNQQVASTWGTDPETSKEILMGWYREEIKDFR